MARLATDTQDAQNLPDSGQIIGAYDLVAVEQGRDACEAVVRSNIHWMG